MNRATALQALGFSTEESPDPYPSSWSDLKGAIRSGIGTGTSAFGALAPADPTPEAPPDYTEVIKWAGLAAGAALALAVVLHIARKV